jgi:hypothetical protein
VVGVFEILFAHSAVVLARRESLDPSRVRAAFRVVQKRQLTAHRGIRVSRVGADVARRNE